MESLLLGTSHKSFSPRMESSIKADAPGKQNSELHFAIRQRDATKCRSLIENGTKDIEEGVMLKWRWFMICRC